MQPMPNEPSEDDKGWDPNQDPDFEKEANFGGPNTFSERASNPIFDNTSIGQARPIADVAHEFNNQMRQNLGVGRSITDEDERQSLV